MSCSRSRPFANLPADLHESPIAHIVSIHRKPGTLSYEVLPAGSCHLDRCVPAASTLRCPRSHALWQTPIQQRRNGERRLKYLPICRKTTHRQSLDASLGPNFALASMLAGDAFSR